MIHVPTNANVPSVRMQCENQTAIWKANSYYPILIQANISGGFDSGTVKVKYRLDGFGEWFEEYLVYNFVTGKDEATIPVDFTRINNGLEYYFEVEDSGIPYYYPIDGYADPIKPVIYTEPFPPIQEMGLGNIFLEIYSPVNQSHQIQIHRATYNWISPSLVDTYDCSSGYNSFYLSVKVEEGASYAEI